MELKVIIKLLKQALQEAGVMVITNNGEIICVIDSIDPERITNFRIKKDSNNGIINLYFSNLPTND